MGYILGILGLILAPGGWGLGIYRGGLSGACGFAAYGAWGLFVFVPFWRLG